MNMFHIVGIANLDIETQKIIIVSPKVLYQFISNDLLEIVENDYENKKDDRKSYIYCFFQNLGFECCENEEDIV